MSLLLLLLLLLFLFLWLWPEQHRRKRGDWWGHPQIKTKQKYSFCFLVLQAKQQRPSGGPPKCSRSTGGPTPFWVSWKQTVKVDDKFWSQDQHVVGELLLGNTIEIVVSDSFCDINPTPTSNLVDQLVLQPSRLAVAHLSANNNILRWTTNSLII